MHRRLINILLVPFLAIATGSLLWLLLQPPLRPTETEQTELSSQAGASIATVSPEVQTQRVAYGAAPAQPTRRTARQAASIVVTKTVGLTGNDCGTSDVITVTAGTDVYFCFQVRNTGAVTLTHHTVVDDKIGVRLDNQIITLTPDLASTAEAFFTAVVRINDTLFNTVTWTATDGGEIAATATDTSTVLVPTILVTYTVGRDPHVCAEADRVAVPFGSVVTHCYTVHNNGAIPFRLHEVSDSQLGEVAIDWPYFLAPGASVAFTRSGIVTETTTGVVTWTARLSDTLSAVAVDEALTQVPAIEVATTVGLEPHFCAPTSAITVTYGTAVTYCYLITNTGGVTLTHYDVYDTALNGEYLSITHELPGNLSLFFTVTQTVTQSQLNTVDWIAATEEGYTTTGQAGATVNALSLLNVRTFYDVDRKLGQNDMEPAVDDVTIRLQTPHQQTLITTTNKAGIAVFSDLPTGVYTVTAILDHLRGGFLVDSVTNTQVITLLTADIYTVPLGLTKSLDTDSDKDGFPDWQEGSLDRDLDGVPDFLDPTQMLYLAYVDR
jgi:hypothetical protein